MPALLDVLWQSEAGSTLTAPIVAGGKVFAARVDEHQVLARDAADGRPLWAFTADGRIDSPPAFARGPGGVRFARRLGLLPSRGGRRAGVEVPGRARQRQIGAFNQLESAWPVSGSILIHRGLVYLAAGRSSHLDGGIYLYGLDLATGKAVHQARLEGPEPDVKAMSINFKLPEGAVADILTVAEDSILMHGVALDENLSVRQPRPAAKKGAGKSLPSAGLSRRRRIPGRQLLQTYAMALPGRLRPVRQSVCHDRHDRLRHADVRIAAMPHSRQLLHPGRKGLYLLCHRGTCRAESVWSKKYPLRATALVATGAAVFAAGPPDVVDPADPLGALRGPQGWRAAGAGSEDRRRTGTNAPRFAARIQRPGRGAASDCSSPVPTAGSCASAGNGDTRIRADYAWKKSAKAFGSTAEDISALPL